MTLLTLTQVAKTAGIARLTSYRLQNVFSSLQYATKTTGQHNASQDVALLNAHIDALERENGLLRDKIQASQERESKLLDVVS